MNIGNLKLTSEQLSNILQESYTFRQLVATQLLSTPSDLKSELKRRLERAAGNIVPNNKIIVIKELREIGNSTAEFNSILPGAHQIDGKNYFGLAEAKAWVEKEYNI